MYLTKKGASYDFRTAYLKMISYDHGSPERIQHFLKVHSFAKTIAVSEYLDEKTLFITEAAAIVHDIGIRLCLEKYGDGNGKLQEKKVLPWQSRCSPSWDLKKM